jgi:hypothetical protein
MKIFVKILISTVLCLFNFLVFEYPGYWVNMYLPTVCAWEKKTLLPVLFRHLDSHGRKEQDLDPYPYQHQNVMYPEH